MPLHRLLLSGLILGTTLSLQATPGDVDATFDAHLSGNQTIAMQQDGRILVAGNISIGGTYKSGIVRLNRDGSLDPWFLADVAGVSCVALQPDGKVLIGGSFDTVNGTTRQRVARLLPDGSLDATFTASLNGPVSGISVQADGKVLVWGWFTVTGSALHKGLARLKADGSLDNSFTASPDVAGSINTVLIQADTSIALGGSFLSINGTARAGLARVSSTGVLDALNPTSLLPAGSDVKCLAVQADGRLIVGGKFTPPSGVPRGDLARLNADGSVDTAFSLSADGDVQSLAVQADGKLIVGGRFGTLGGAACRQMARVLPEGGVDGGFVPALSSTSVNVVRQVLLGSNGEILAQGDLRTTGAVTQANLVRLVNDTTSPLIVATPGGTVIKWMRDGSAPEISEAGFYVSLDRGSTSSFLGTATRITGGWQLSGVSVPASGQIVARSHTAGGAGFGVYAPVSLVSVVGRLATPEITVETEAGTALKDGGSCAFTALVPGRPTAQRFVIRNTGERVLTISSVTLTGTHAAQFQLSPLTGTQVIPPDSSLSFSVTANPTSTGVKTAAFHIKCDDADESMFDVTLTGSATLSHEAQLATLTPSTGALTPAFVPGTLAYSLSVPFATDAMRLTPTLLQADAKVEINGVAIASGTQSAAISLRVGTQPIPVLVTAQDGVTTRAYTITVTRAAGTPGELDPTIASQAIPNAQVVTMATEPDGSVLIGGVFTRFAGVPCHGLVRMRADHTLDMAFVPELTLSTGTTRGIYRLLVDHQGRIYIIGEFDGVGGVARNGFARLQHDGHLDESFDLTGSLIIDYIYGMTAQANGGLVLRGSFSSDGGVTKHELARLQPDGKVDTSFQVTTDGGIGGVKTLPDGRLIVHGSFTTINGITCNSLARLDAEGHVDAGYNPALTGQVVCLMTQVDGSVICSEATRPPGSTGSYVYSLTHFLPDGTRDSSFIQSLTVRYWANDFGSLMAQTDGKVIVVASMDDAGGSSASGVARINSDGSWDSSFSLTNSYKYGFGGAINSDGELWSGGWLLRTSCKANPGASQTLSVTGGSRIEWLRGGTSPEAAYVRFQLSTDHGATYTELGTGSRITGGWELTGLSLPAQGQVRALARTVSGYLNGSSGLVSAVTAFGQAARPEIAVEYQGSNLQDNAPLDLGSINALEPNEFRFLIRNTGESPLTISAVKLDGPDAALFSVVTPPASLIAPASGGTSLTLRMAAVSPGVRHAVLHITSDDADETVFDVPLSVSAVISNNARLRILTVPSGTLSPAFSPDVLSYTVSLPINTASIVAIPATDQPAATVTINGMPVISGVASPAIPLMKGRTVIPVVVTAMDGVTTRRYELTIDRPDSDLGPAFWPSPTSSPTAIAVQPDGKILLSAAFDPSSNIPEALVRYHPDGSRDTSFHKTWSAGAVYAIAMLADGKALVADTALRRMNADGTPDPSFTVSSCTTIRSIQLQPDGRIIMVGTFTTVGGVARNRIARMNADGTLDATFDPNANNTVSSAVVLPDGRIMIGGDFTQVGGVTANHLARLLSDGTVDTSVTLYAYNSVGDLALQPDGRVLVADYGVSRIKPDGTVDIGFMNSLDSSAPSSMAPLEDGRILGASNGFYQANGVYRYALARLLPDGDVDASFDPGFASTSLSSLAVCPDGAIVAGGSFTTVGGYARSRAALFIGGTATQSLTVTAPDRIEWVRSGPAPAVTQVRFLLSTDHGTTFTPLPDATYQNGRWQVQGIVLPTEGQLRATGRTTSGRYNGSSGMVQCIAAFGRAAAPEIRIDSADTGIANGGAIDLGAVPPLDSKEVTLRISNTGEADLTGVTVAIDGPDASLFQVVTTPTAVVHAGCFTLLTIRFAPTSTGARSAMLHMVSNDSDESSYDIALSGNGVLSANADLTSLSVSGVQLSPIFAPATTSYAIDIPFNKTSLSITPKTAQMSAAVTINGQPVISGAVAPDVPMNVGINVISIVVTAQDGVTTKAYEITATRAPTEAAGDLDLSFTTQADDKVTCTAALPDGGLMLGGQFLTMAGQPRSNIARLNQNGDLTASVTLEITPYPSFRWADVQAVAVQPDGKVILGGHFGSIAGNAKPWLARLNADGSLDTDFPANKTNSQLLAILPLPDGKILIGGDFSFVGSSSKKCLARLNNDGSLDSTFGGSPNNTVSSIARQSDGQIVVGGTFTSVGGTTRNRVARLTANGALDSSFNPDADGSVYAVALQPDGKVLLAGAFTSVGGVTRNRLARLNSDGSVDTTFPDLGASSSLLELALQCDGRIIVGGLTTSVSGIGRASTARLNADGTVDSSFRADGNLSAESLQLRPDGTLVVGGFFTRLSGFDRARLALVKAGIATDELMVVDNSHLRWMRGGAAPEVLETTFEIKPFGSSIWTLLGPGTRISGGWELAQNLPANGIIRARARVPSGNRNGSSGLIEKTVAFTGYAAPQIMVEAPSGTALNNGSTVTFPKVALGQNASQTFTLRNTGNGDLTGVAITFDGSNPADFTVTQSPAVVVPPGGRTTFTIRCQPSVAGTCSAILHLTNNDPSSSQFDLSLQGSSPSPPSVPVLASSVLATTGSALSLTPQPAVAGEAPLAFLWKKDGVKLAGKTAASLAFSALKDSDAGIYDVSVTNSLGSKQSNYCSLFVATPLPAVVLVNEGASLSLNCTVKAPASTVLNYQWYHGSTPLSDDIHVTGSFTKTLRILNTTPADAGAYHCDIQATHPGFADTTFTLSGTSVIVVRTPSITAPTLPDVRVGETVSIPVSSVNAPTKFTALNLPPGIGINPATGQLSGRPTTVKYVAGQPVAYAVKITASNSKGSFTTPTIPWKVLPLPDGSLGTFNGLVDRWSPLNSGLGGSISITTQSNGSFTGSVKLGARSVSITGTLSVPTGGGNPTGQFKLSSTSPLSTFTLHLAEHAMSGWINDGANNGCPFQAWQSLWSTSRKPEASLTGSFNAALLPPADALTSGHVFPQGSGYARLTVSTSGSVTSVARLADASVITFSSSMGPQGQIAMYQALYGNTGSATGWSMIDAATGRIDGSLSWNKAAQAASSATTSYKSGFPLHLLTLSGERYTPPVAGSLLLGVAPAPPDNAKLEFSLGALPAPIVQAFQITATNTAKMPSGTVLNPYQTSLTLTASTGLFSGSFTLINADPRDLIAPYTMLSRTAKFYGLIVTRAGIHQGVGHFNLAELPDTAGETVLKTPVWSGKMELGPP